MKILIFSGGSASKNFQKKLYELGYECDNLVNLYDDGLSTGLVREAMDWTILGPSDMRKNQLVKHEIHHGKTPLYELLSQRFTLNDSSKLQSYLYGEIDKYVQDMVNNKILKTGVDFYIKHAKKTINYNDFSLANVIYAGFFKEFGVEKTHTIFKKLLDIPEDVIVNSYNNLRLTAKTRSCVEIKSEYEIVNWNNKNNEKIFDIDLMTNGLCSVIPSPNKLALNKILEADVIVFFAGTQWSSLIPTYVTNGMKDTIEVSKANKFLILNNENDTDMIDTDNVFLYQILEKYLPMKEIKVIYNKDSVLEPPYQEHITGSFGKGRTHDVEKLALFILKEYMKQKLKERQPTPIVFDFDYTLFDYKDKETSEENLNLLKNLSCKMGDLYIVTGNTFKHISKIMDDCGGCGILDIYSDNGMIKNNDETKEEFIITEEEQRIIEKILRNETYDKVNCGEVTLLYRMKNIFDNREEKIDSLNKRLPIGFKAFQRGVASIEIHKEFITKLDYISKEVDLDNCLYLGDEHLGNDEIFFRLYNCIKISDIRVTNAFLKALGELYEI